MTQAPAAQVTVLFPAEEIARRVQGMADDIVQSMPSDVMMIALLRGSFVFTADLMRAMHHAGARPQVDFMTLSSYGGGTVSSGNVEIHRDVSEAVAGRDVLIVDDILESGRTLAFARNLIRERGANSIRIAVLLEKPAKRVNDIKADFIGFSIPDRFVVGYGLDYANYYRELPFIGVIAAEGS